MMQKKKNQPHKARQNNKFNKDNFNKGRSSGKQDTNKLPGDRIVIYGKHASFSAIKAKRRKIFRILVSKNTNIELEKILSEQGLSHLQKLVSLADSTQIESVAGQGHLHQGIAVECSKLPVKNQNDLLDELYSLDKKNLPGLILLDQLSDPQNIGAIIRSAISFGVKKVIFCDHHAPKESATMAKSSAGTIELADLVVVTNFSNLIERLKKIGYWIVGLEGTSKNPISDIKDYDHVALVVGSEGTGIRSLVKKNCDLLTKINIDKDVESLNASVATSIALYELSKK